MGEASGRSDAELVVAARIGDKDAFALLVDRHRPMVCALVARVLDPAAASDAAQEAAITALISLDRLRSPERFGAWYAGIALNVARRWFREAVDTVPLSDECRDDRPGPEELAEVADLGRRVRRAVEGLAPGQRQAVLAFYWLGLTHAEAAVELGVSPGAVKARLHQARAVLAPELVPHILVEREVPSMPTPAAEPAWIPVEVAEIRRSGGDDPSRRLHVVVLHELGGDRRLPIYVGAAEATSLACTLEAVETPRPMTYDMAARLAEAAGARVSEVRITRLAESTFYAAVHLDSPAGPAEVDTRPSDALNLALVCGVPIAVDPAVFDHQGPFRHPRWRTAWEDFDTRAPEIAAEVRDRQRELMAPSTADEPEAEDPDT